MDDKKKWYQKISNWIFALLVIILVPILIANLYIMVQANNDKDKVPSVFGYKPFIVLSGSMETNIHVGDLIITKITNPAKLKVKDVIAFRDAENTVTTHRIIDMVKDDGKTYFVTKGDNNDSQDQNLVEYKDVEGIYVGRIPGIGTMLNQLAKPTTIVIVLLGISIIFMLLFKISNKKLKDEEEKEFLEYKKMKEQQKKSSSKNKSKKATSKKEDEDKVMKTPTKKQTSSTKTSKASTKKSATKSTTTKKATTTKAGSKKASSSSKAPKKVDEKKTTTAKKTTTSTRGRKSSTKKDTK